MTAGLAAAPARAEVTAGARGAEAALVTWLSPLESELVTWLSPLGSEPELQASSCPLLKRELPG